MVKKKSLQEVEAVAEPIAVEEASRSDKGM
jgi:hypothetical protein